MKFKNKKQKQSEINLGKVSELRGILDHFDDDSDVIISPHDENMTQITCVDNEALDGKDEYVNAIFDTYLNNLRNLKYCNNDNDVEGYTELVRDQVKGIDTGDIVADNLGIDEDIMNFLDVQLDFVKRNVANYIDVKNGRNFVEMARLVKNK